MQVYLIKPSVVAPIVAIAVIIMLAFSWSVWVLVGIPFAVLGTICGQPNLNLADGCLALIAIGIGLLIAAFHREIGFAIAASSFAGILGGAVEKTIRGTSRLHGNTTRCIHKRVCSIAARLTDAGFRFAKSGPCNAKIR